MMKKRIAALLMVSALALGALPVMAEAPAEEESALLTEDAPEEAEDAQESGEALEEAAEQESEDAAEEPTQESGDAATERDYAAFPEWTPGAPALDTLIDYVESVTDESSEDFIPAKDRIAVFDMDGTLTGELYPTYFEYYMLAWRILKDPDYLPDAETLEVGRTIRDCALDKSFPEDMPVQHALAAAHAYAGMTLDEFDAYVQEVMSRECDGFEGMTVGEAYYRPMVNVVDYLRENDFTIYVVSGSDRFICRAQVRDSFGIPSDRVIGMDDTLVATGQGETDPLDYTFSPEDTVVRGNELIIKNLKVNKVYQILQEIGRQPVLSFGNSSGDTSMHVYTISNNPYKSAAFMLIADDEVRDYGSEAKGPELREKWEGYGFNVISMRDDFQTIYGEDVVRTGSFRWLRELSDERTDAEVDALEEAGKDTEPEAADAGQEADGLAGSEADESDPGAEEASAEGGSEEEYPSDEPAADAKAVA